MLTSGLGLLNGNPARVLKLVPNGMSALLEYYLLFSLHSRS